MITAIIIFAILIGIAIPLIWIWTTHIGGESDKKVEEMKKRKNNHDKSLF